MYEYIQKWFRPRGVNPRTEDMALLRIDLSSFFPAHLWKSYRWRPPHFLTLGGCLDDHRLRRSLNGVDMHHLGSRLIFLIQGWDNGIGTNDGALGWSDDDGKETVSVTRSII